MKKIFKTILVLCVFILASTAGFAGCSTGFACSISDLDEALTIKNIEFVQNIYNYFNKNVNADLFFNKRNPMLGYNDLFIFSTIV